MSIRIHSKRAGVRHEGVRRRVPLRDPVLPISRNRQIGGWRFHEN